MSTELTLHQVIRYRIHQASDAIHNLKRAHHDQEALKHISPLSPMWKHYQGYKREASVWLTALKLWKVMEHHDEPEGFLKDWNHRHTYLYWHVLTPHMKGRTKIIPTLAKDEPPIIKEALGRLRRLHDQLKHGGVKNVRCYMKHTRDGEGKHKWSLATDVTYVPKDFSKIEAEIKIMLTPRVKEAEHVTSGE